MVFLLLAQEGSILWSRVYGGYDYDWFEKVAVDGLGRYVVVGTSWLAGNFDPDLWLLVVDSSSGDTVRSFLFGDVDSFEWPHDILVHDGKFYVVGQKDTLIWAVGMDSTGNVMWSSTYGGGDASAVALSPDGYIIVGATVPTDTRGEDFAFIRVDPTSGAEVDRWVYGTGNGDILMDLAVDGEGNCVAAGATWGAIYDNYILKFSCTSGDSLWAISFGDDGSNFATGIAVDGEHYVISSFSGFGLDSSWLVVARISSLDGTLEWMSRYRGPVGAYGRDVVVSPSGYYVVLGDYQDTAGVSLWILKVNPSDGDTLWSVLYRDTVNIGAMGLVAGPSGEYVAVGQIDLNSTDGLIVKVAGENPVSRMEYPYALLSIQVLPGGLKLESAVDGTAEVNILRPSGRVVRRVRMDALSSVRIALPSGVYVVEWGGGARTVIVP